MWAASFRHSRSPEDIQGRLHQTRLLQQRVCWCQWSVTAQDAGDTECCCSSCNWSYEVSVCHRFFEVSIGCQSGSKSPLKRQLLQAYTSAWRRPTSQSTSDAGRRHLQSANTRQLVILRAKTSYGDLSLSVREPTVWNDLQQSTDISLDTFKNKLKTFLFDADTHQHI